MARKTCMPFKVASTSGSRLEYKEDDKSKHQIFIHFPLFQSLQHLQLSQNKEQQKLCKPIKN